MTYFANRRKSASCGAGCRHGVAPVRQEEFVHVPRLPLRSGSRSPRTSCVDADSLTAAPPCLSRSAKPCWQARRSAVSTSLVNRQAAPTDDDVLHHSERVPPCKPLRRRRAVGTPKALACARSLPVTFRLRVASHPLLSTVPTTDTLPCCRDETRDSMLRTRLTSRRATTSAPPDCAATNW